MARAMAVYVESSICAEAFSLLPSAAEEKKEEGPGQRGVSNDRGLDTAAVASGGTRGPRKSVPRRKQP